jgi:integrase
MNDRYRVFRRGWGTYYCEDLLYKKQQSLKTRSRTEAFRLVAAKNEAQEVGGFSRHLAQVYWNAADPAAATRTWQQVMEEIPKLKTGSTRVRWLCAIQDKAFDPLRKLVVLETRSEHFLKVLGQGSVSTHSYLRRIHTFALDMNWLPWPVLPRKRWPIIRFKPKRAITWEEHQKILAGERTPEWHDYYELLWHLGGSQSDVASLSNQDIDWPSQTIAYSRKKTGSLSVLHFGPEAAAILERRPRTGLLFPMLGLWKEADRGKAFIRRCKLVGVSGVSLHCYRYAWAERAKRAGYPERFAQAALGHNSKAVHRAYARHAHVAMPSLESYEKSAAEKNILPFPQRLENPQLKSNATSQA